MNIVHKSERFTMIPNDVFVIPGLTPAARAVLLWALSKAPGWVVIQRNIVRELGMTKHAVGKAIKCLAELGLCHQFRIYNTRTRQVAGHDNFFSSRTISTTDVRNEISKRLRLFERPELRLILGNSQEPDFQALETQALETQELETQSHLKNSSSSLTLSPTKLSLPEDATRFSYEKARDGVGCTPTVQSTGVPNDVGVLCTPTSSCTVDVGVQSTPCPAVPPPLEELRAGGDGAGKPPVKPARVASASKAVTVAPSNVDRIPESRAWVAAAWEAKDVMLWVGQNCETTADGYVPKADAVRVDHAMDGEVHRRLLLGDLQHVSHPAVLKDDEVTALATGLGHAVAAEAFANLSEEDREAFTAETRSWRGPVFELRALLCARRLLVDRLPPATPYPRAQLVVVCDLELPSPRWAVRDEFLRAVQSLWSRVWSRRYAEDFTWRSTSELQRLATVVEYDLRGDVEKFEAVAEAFLARNDDYLVNVRHHPNFLAKNWRAYAVL
jgi:hypothetical protein